MSIQIDADFPGGNIIVDDIEGNRIWMHQDLGETTRPWFYWCFAISGVAGKTVEFIFTSSPCFTSRGPAVSYDDGETWAWLGAGVVSDNAFTYTFADDEDDVRFSMGMPYVRHDWKRFLENWQEADQLQEHALCITRHGRSNKYYTLDSAGETKKRIVITARHHCCEMMVNYAIEGLLEWWCAADHSAATYLSEHVSLLLIPFVDLDGVEEGDQGKGRLGRDHGRDYIGESLYPETPAIKSIIEEWGPELLLDLHCPGQRGEDHELIFIVGSSDERMAAQQLKFAEWMERSQQGPLPLPASDLLPFGTSWNTEANSSPDSGGINKWAKDLPGLRLCTTIEVAYANVHGVEVNAESARQFGPDLGRAIAGYLLSD